MEYLHTFLVYYSLRLAYLLLISIHDAKPEGAFIIEILLMNLMINLIEFDTFIGSVNFDAQYDNDIILHN